MKRSKFPLAIFFVLSIVFTNSCMSTKFMMNPNLPEESKQALLTGMFIGMEEEKSEETDLMDISMTILSNLELDSFGFAAEKALKAYLNTKGFEVFLDADQAKINDLIINVGNKVSALGAWVHPETSAYQTYFFTGFSIGFDKKKHMQTIKGDSNIEYYVYADLKIHKTHTFAIFGGYPLVIFNVVIVNSQGENVLEARALGEGNKQFIGVDTSEKNLSVAFNNAIENLNKLK